MKILFAFSLVLLIWAASLKPTLHEKVDQQIEESEALHDTAMYYLREIHIKNDSLLDAYFPIDSTAK